MDDEGRTTSWVKTKFWNEQDLVVGGRLPSENSRDAIGALLCADWVRRGQLQYRCCVRSGYSERQKATLYRQLRERKTPAFQVPPSGWRYRGARWCRPQLVASVRYLDRSARGRLRMTTFRGVRDDE
jgi:bifunctional non-homologous end joining protein LigD